jgi:hypothetical protein
LEVADSSGSNISSLRAEKAAVPLLMSRGQQRVKRLWGRQLAAAHLCPPGPEQCHVMLFHNLVKTRFFVFLFSMLASLIFSHFFGGFLKNVFAVSNPQS